MSSFLSIQLSCPLLGIEWQESAGYHTVKWSDRAMSPWRTSLSVIQENYAAILVHLLVFLVTSFSSFAAIAGGYYAFYLWYVPRQHSTIPIHLDYAYDSGRAIAGVARLPYPRAGVAYDVSLELEVPDIGGLSEQIGNLMVDTSLLTIPKSSLQKLQQAETVDQYANVDALSRTRRTTLLPYRSAIVTNALRVIRLLPVLLNFVEESRTHRVFLATDVVFSDLLTSTSSDDQVFAVRVVIDNVQLPVYSARVALVAHFTHLRYLLYYWRWSCAFVVIGLLGLVCVFFLAAAIGFSLYKSLTDGSVEDRSINGSFTDFHQSETVNGDYGDDNDDDGGEELYFQDRHLVVGKSAAVRSDLRRRRRRMLSREADLDPEEQEEEDEERNHQSSSISVMMMHPTRAIRSGSESLLRIDDFKDECLDNVSTTGIISDDHMDIYEVSSSEEQLEVPDARDDDDGVRSNSISDSELGGDDQVVDEVDIGQLVNAETLGSLPSDSE